MKLYLLALTIATIFFSCTNTKTSSGLVKYTFVYHSVTADKVSVSGSFNNWSAETNPLTYNGNGEWKAEIELQPNHYQYKFVVDGNWIPDPQNDWKINDGGDNFNSIVKVGNPPTPQRKTSNRPFPKDQLPEPILENDSQLIEIYYAA